MWTLIFGWKLKLGRRTFIDVVSTLAKQRWNNVNRITSAQRRWTNVVSTLKFGWKWKLSRRMFIDVVSTLTTQRLNNIEKILSIQCRWPNVHILLKRKVESTFVHRRCFDIDQTALKKLYQLLNWCSLESGSKTKKV